MDFPGRGFSVNRKKANPLSGGFPLGNFQLSIPHNPGRNALRAKGSATFFFSTPNNSGEISYGKIFLSFSADTIYIRVAIFKTYIS